MAKSYKGLKLFTVRTDWRFESAKDEPEAWNRETFVILAPNADKALAEAIGISKRQEDSDFGPTVHRLAEVIEGDGVDGVVLK